MPESERVSLQRHLSLLLNTCIQTKKNNCCTPFQCQPQINNPSCLTSPHPTRVPVFFPPFEAPSLFLPSPLPALKGWSVTELVASFIGVSQQPGDKGQLKCNNVPIFCLCAQMQTHEKTTDIQSSALKSWNTVEGMEAHREDEGGCLLCNWLR